MIAPLQPPDREARGGAPLVAFDRVDKTFANGTVALKGLSFAVARGEFVSLLGPSGCGKSTALRLVAGLGEPGAGGIDWPMTGGEAGKTGIGFVFQEPTLMPWATVFNNVWLPLRLSGVSKRAARQEVMDTLRLVGLDGFTEAYPRELSGGMKMRVSIARALVMRPGLLLMDEPFGALDEITRFKLNDELLQLWRALGCTIIFVTHSVFESVYLSSRILVMTSRPGRIAADIPIDAPYPRNESFRTSGEYNGYCREVSAALHRAMDVYETA